MIRAQVFQSVTPEQEPRISRFLIEGHAESGEYGKDIVCAAVSALAINFVNSVEALCGTRLQVKMRSGYMDIRVVTDEKVQWLAKSLRVGLSGIAKEHSQFLQVKDNFNKMD